MIWFIAILLSIVAALLVLIIVQIHFVSNYIVDVIVNKVNSQGSDIQEVLMCVQSIDKVTGRMRSGGY